jgi:hypothetical protein
MRTAITASIETFQRLLASLLRPTAALPAVAAALQRCGSACLLSVRSAARRPRTVASMLLVVDSRSRSCVKQVGQSGQLYCSSSSSSSSSSTVLVEQLSLHCTSKRKRLMKWY